MGAVCQTLLIFPLNQSYQHFISLLSRFLSSTTYSLMRRKKVFKAPCLLWTVGAALPHPPRAAHLIEVLAESSALRKCLGDFLGDILLLCDFLHQIIYFVQIPGKVYFVGIF